VVVYLLAEAAALLFAVGSVVQQRVAAEAPPEKALSLSLLLYLVRQRRWLIGTGSSLIGNLLAAAALSMGGVALVEPLLTTRLLIVLPLTAVTGRLRIPVRDWVAALLAAGGLATFVAVGRPRHGPALAATGLRWGLAVGAVAVLAGLVVALVRRREVTRAALGLGAAAGLLFGLQASLTESATALMRRGGASALVTHFQPLMVAVTAVAGALFIQSAYEMAPLPASFPALVTVEPITGVIVGMAVLHGVIDTSGAALGTQSAGLVAMVVGVALLARSPVVTGQALALQRRREEGLAHRSAHHLEQLLGEVQEAVGGSCEAGRPHRHRTAHARSRLDRARHLLEELSELREAEARHLSGLPDKERLALAPLERELEERQERLETWAADLSGALDRLEDTS
jgi:hypothetical protein